LLHSALELTPTDVTARELLKKADLATPTSGHGVAHLGRHEAAKQDGDPESVVERKFTCGKEHDKWCTIHLVISFYKADNERLKITLTGEGDNKRTVFLKKETTADLNTSNSQQFAVSVRGCNE